MGLSDENDVEFDEAGDPVVAPSPETAVGEAVAAIKQIMEWGRKRGFQIGPEVQVGEVVIRIRDLRQAKDLAKPGAKEQDIWEEHGLNSDS